MLSTFYPLHFCRLCIIIFNYPATASFVFVAEYSYRVECNCTEILCLFIYNFIKIPTDTLSESSLHKVVYNIYIYVYNELRGIQSRYIDALRNTKSKLVSVWWIVWIQAGLFLLIKLKICVKNPTVIRLCIMHSVICIADTYAIDPLMWYDN